MPPHSPYQSGLLTRRFDWLSTEGALTSQPGGPQRDSRPHHHASEQVKIISINTFILNFCRLFVALPIGWRGIFLFGYATNYFTWVTKHSCIDAPSVKGPCTLSLMLIKNTFLATIASCLCSKTKIWFYLLIIMRDLTKRGNSSCTAPLRILELTLTSCVVVVCLSGSKTSRLMFMKLGYLWQPL